MQVCRRPIPADSGLHHYKAKAKTAKPFFL